MTRRRISTAPDAIKKLDAKAIEVEILEKRAASVQLSVKIAFKIP